MYSLISANKFRTVLLFSIIIAVVSAIGLGVGYFFNDYSATLYFIAIVMIATTFVFFSATGSVLKAVGGRELDLNDPKELMLKNIVENISITAGIPTPPVYLIPDAGLNAFAAGLSPEKAVVGCTAGLLATMDKSEIEAVMAHEISHIRNYDTRVSIAAYSIAVALLFIGDMLIRTRGNKNPLPLVGLAILVVGYPAVLLTRLAISRQREYLADMGSVELTRNPEGMASALEKLKDGVPMHVNANVAHMMFNNSASGFFANLMSTHPPLDARIERVRQSFTHM